MHKTLTLTLIISIFITNVSQAQKQAIVNQKLADSIKTAVFTINLGIPNLRTVKAQISRKSLQFGTAELAVLQLQNGNPFKYKYVINTNMVSFFTEGNNPIDSAAIIHKTKLAPVTPDKPAPEIQALQKKLDSIKIVNESLNSQIYSKNANLPGKYTDALKDSVAKNEKRYNSISKTIRSARDSSIRSYYEQQNSRLSPISNSLDYEPEKKQLNIKTDSTAKTLEKVLANLRNNALLIQQKAAKLSDDITEFNAELLSEDCIVIDTFKKSRDLFKKSYFKLLTDVNEMDGVAQNVKGSTDGDYVAYRNKIEEYLKDMHNRLHLFYSVHLENYILPIDVNGKNIDLLKVSVERHEGKTAALIDKYEYQLWVKGGLKFDVSGGAFVTSLVNDKYITVDDAVTTGQKYIYKSNAGKYEIGFGSMLNVSYRTGAAWLRPSLSIGALFSNEQKFQFLTGFGLMIGKEQRVILHGGLSLGNVTRIEAPYTVSTDAYKISYNLGASTQVPTSEKFEFGHYWGVTYNFGTAKAKVPGVKEY